MVQRKHLVAIATAIGLLIFATPSHATLILKSVAGTLGVNGTTDDFGGVPKDIISGPSGAQFIFDQDVVTPPALSRSYAADFDSDDSFPGKAELTLRYEVGDAGLGLGAAIWVFDNFNWGTTPGKIKSVDVSGGNPTVVMPIVTNAGQRLRFVLPARPQLEGQQTWEFTINSEAAPVAAPAPGTLLLVGVGLLGLARTRRRS